MDYSTLIVLVFFTLCNLSNYVSSRSTTDRNALTPRGCKWQRFYSSVDDTDVQSLLSCKLRTIGSTDSLIGNLSSYQIEKITAIKLECSDVLFFESSLEGNAQHTSAGAFLGTLKRLRDLRIEYCKIRYVPSMVFSNVRDLRSLSLKTHNSDWSAMSLEFHPESFRGLTELKMLDLSDNNIWSLPPDVFCPLYSLRFLNLTRNRLTDITSLGFSDWGNGPTAPGKACNTGLEVLDLSRNDLSKMPDNGLTGLRSLQKLNLQDNKLSNLADRSFVGLGSLKVLNISNNLLTILPPELFQSPRQLEQIYLQNNSLSVLAPGLLEGLDRLITLDLSHNELSNEWVNRDTFAGLVRLVVLNLGYNSLTKIDHHVFKGLIQLQILNLEYNSIEVIADNAFDDLKNLHALTLSHNRLKRIEAHHLSDLYVLTQLFLESNQIDTIHARAFENLTNLNDLSLNDNQLGQIPDGLNKLRFLKSLDLGKNQIKEVRNESFEGLEQLLGLRLVDNHITSISKDAFITLSSLHVLNLASNRIKDVDANAFTSNPTIRAIRLDNNEIEDIKGIFNNLPTLVWLNVSDNNIQYFDYSSLPPSLEWLDLHENQISELGDYFGQKEELKLKMLDVSFNRITKVTEETVPNSIETLFLNNNLIEEVAAGTFLKKANIEKVVLYANFIRRMEIAAIALSRIPDHKEMPQFFIGDNPILCDCHMEWLQSINELSHLRQHPRIMDLDAVMCNMEHDRGNMVRPLMEVNPKEFLCRYETHCYATCHCCDFDACDCKMTCPDRCNCYHDHTWGSNIVDCGSAGYTSVPEKIPMDASTIYLDGNDLNELPSHMFIGKKKLEVLYLNNSNIASLHNRTFSGIPGLKVLHMDNNNLRELRGFEFDQLVNMNKLYLNHNSIQFVSNRTFNNLKKLEVLNLNDNKINNFTPWTQLKAASESGALTKVSLDGIKWDCTCDQLFKLQQWIKEMSNEYDLNRMICLDDRVVGDVVISCADNKHNERAIATPAVHRTVIYQNPLIGGGYIPLLAAVLVAIIGTALVFALICVFRQDVRLWAHAKYGLRLFRDPSLAASEHDEKDKLYDSYVIYSLRDQQFVTHTIAGGLQYYGYTTCLHHRDIHSTTFLSDSLQSAADASRRIILTLSMNFIKNEWTQPQFQVALQSLIESIRPNQRKHKLILILLAPVDLIALEPIMQILIRSCTVICWGEKRFWDKLRFALPDINSERSIKKMGNITRSPNLRYTPAPTTVDTWCKMSRPGHAVSIPVPHSHQNTPSQSTCNTEDESSSSGAGSQHYEAPMCQVGSQIYSSRSQNSLGHVYSTIPETPQMARCPPPMDPRNNGDNNNKHESEKKVNSDYVKK
uniref:CSON003960 protein n=1 Tax=Culicoides sonorensis TaxID=179676 RepID=A0A336LWU3_CULSO